MGNPARLRGLARRGAGDVQPPQWANAQPYSHTESGGGPVPVILFGGSRIQSLADRAVTTQKTILRAASQSRISLVITNNDGATNIRFGDENTDATHGARLGPGQSARITSRGDIYVITEAGTATISMSEEIL